MSLFCYNNAYDKTISWHKVFIENVTSCKYVTFNIGYMTMSFWYSLHEYILLIILYFYLSHIVNSGILPVTDYFFFSGISTFTEVRELRASTTWVRSKMLKNIEQVTNQLSNTSFVSGTVLKYNNIYWGYNKTWFWSWKRFQVDHLVVVV